MARALKLLMIGDIHHQASDRDSLLCARVLDMWRRFASAARPDAFIQVGDIIDGYKLPHDVSRKDLIDAMAALNSAADPVPFHTIIGNHESYWLPDRPFHLKAMGLETMNRVLDLGSVRIVFLDLTVDDDSYGDLTPERAAWLSEALKASPTKPAIIIQHQPIHPEEDVCTHRHYVRNSGEYRRVLQNFDNVAFIITGHKHIPTLATINGRVPQVTLGAFCAHPFTIGEIHVDAAGRTLTFRDLELDSFMSQADRAAVAPSIEHGRRLMVAENPAVWQGRPRLTPELQQIVVEWHGERAIRR